MTKVKNFTKHKWFGFLMFFFELCSGTLKMLLHLD